MGVDPALVLDRGLRLVEAWGRALSASVVLVRAIREAIAFFGAGPRPITHLGRLCRDPIHPASQAVEVVLGIATRCQVIRMQGKHFGDLAPYRRPFLGSSSVLFRPLSKPQER